MKDGVVAWKMIRATESLSGWLNLRPLDDKQEMLAVDAFHQLVAEIVLAAVVGHLEGIDLQLGHAAFSQEAIDPLDQ